VSPGAVRVTAWVAAALAGWPRFRFFGSWVLGRKLFLKKLHNILVTTTPKTAYSCYRRNEETA